MADIKDIIEKTKELGELLKDSEQVKAFNAARLAYDENKEIQELLGKFNIHKMSIAALSKQENPDESRIAHHEEQLNEIYGQIMESELMISYQEKSQAVEQLLAEINNILNFYVSGETPQGCTGSCATCGGCSSN